MKVVSKLCKNNLLTIFLRKLVKMIILKPQDNQLVFFFNLESITII